jgi:hypothetical protein
MRAGLRGGLFEALAQPDVSPDGVVRPGCQGKGDHAGIGGDGECFSAVQTIEENGTNQGARRNPQEDEKDSDLGNVDSAEHLRPPKDAGVRPDQEEIRILNSWQGPTGRNRLAPALGGFSRQARFFVKGASSLRVQVSGPRCSRFVPVLWSLRGRGMEQSFLLCKERKDKVSARCRDRNSLRRFVRF